MRYSGSCRFLVPRSIAYAARRQFVECIHAATVAGARAHVSQAEQLCLRYLSGVLRILVHPDWLFDFQVDLPASSFGGAADNQRFGLDDLSATADRTPTFPRHRRRLCSRRNTTRAMVDCDGCERSTMEGAGQRSSGMAMGCAFGGSFKL